MEDPNPFKFEESTGAVAVYRGKGSLFIGEEEGPACEFYSIQLPNANIQVKCALKGPLGTAKQPTHLQGITNDGFSIKATLYPFVCSTTFTGDRFCLYLAKDLAVRIQPSSGPIHRLRFGLTNFEVPPKALFQVAGRTVTVKRVQGYQERLNVVKQLRGIDVMSEVAVEADSTDRLREVCELMDDLCLLFTLARGTKINWIYYEALEDQQSWVERYHRNVVVKSYSPFALIARDNPRDLKEFVEQAYVSLQKLKDCCQRQRKSFWYAQAVDALADAKLEQDFLELRGLKLTSVLEFIRSVYLRDRDAEHIVSEDEFKSKYAELEKEMRQLLRRFFSSQTAEEMCKHTQGLNWPTFRRTVREMTQSLGLSVSKDELNKIVEYRNELVHRMRFFKDSGNTRDTKGTKKDLYSAYLTMMNFIEQILLAVLGYQGYYLDHTKHTKGVCWEAKLRTFLSLDKNAASWPKGP